ncbi:MAG: tRNA pseudouridine(55) synthase TruB [Casimicrobiaceae bacterium]
MKKVFQVRVERRPVDGVLLLDKPVGLSSNAALQRAKRMYRAEKAGHTGTLDPLASGLLPLCFGEATKFAQMLLDAPKRYTATVRFGVATETGDAEGAVRATHPVTFGADELTAALARFTGRIAQVPHAYSALKYQGRAYYDYARAGEAIPRMAREVEIHALRLLEWNVPDAVLDVECSKGTYIRVLAEDIGDALGCGAHLAGLRRTATGGYSIGSAVPLADLEAMSDADCLRLLRPVATLVSDLAVLALDATDALRFRQGQAVAVPGSADGICAVFGGDRFLGVATVAMGVAQPRRVLVERPSAVGQAA